MGAVGYTGGDPNKVDIAGDTMTGLLILSADPVDPLGAATKQFAESSGGGGGGGTPSNTVVTETAFGQAAAAGASSNYSRGDHTHGTPAAPAAPPSASGTVVAETTYSQASTAGAAATFSRGDHTHGTPALPTPAAIGAATTGALASHEADGTAVHGIADTAQLATLTDIAGRQPLDSDLTAIAALTPTNDDVIQRKAGAWTNRTMDQLTTDLALVIADIAGLQAALDAKQALDSDLTAIAGLTPTNDDIIQRKAGAWVNRTMTQLKTDLAVAIADVSGLQAALDGKQPLDSDLTTIAGLTATTDNMIMSVSNAWASRTPAQVKTALAIAIGDITSLQSTLDGKVDESLLDAKGDLYVASAADTPGRLAVGTDGHVLTADSAQSLGVKWAAGGGGGSGLSLARALVPANGKFYATLWGPNGGNLAVSLNRLYAMALPMGLAKQLDTIAVDVATAATGGSGSVLRAMLLSATAGGLPDVALADFGTKSAESTGQKSWAAAEGVNEALSANTLYYIGIVAQTSVAGGLALRTVNSYDPYVGDSVAVSGTASFGAYYNNGITGTLGGAFTITSVDTALRVSVSFS